MDSPVTIQPQKVTVGDIKNVLNLHEAYRLLTGIAFLELNVIEKLNAICSSLKIPPSPLRVATATYQYDPEQEGDLAFQAGDEIAIFEMGENGWWLGELHGKQGLVPSNFITLNQDDQYILDSDELGELSEILVSHLTEENHASQAISNLKQKMRSMIIDFIKSNGIHGKQLTQDQLNIIEKLPHKCIALISESPDIISLLSILYDLDILDEKFYKATTKKAQHHLTETLFDLCKIKKENINAYIFICKHLPHIDFQLFETDLDYLARLRITENVCRLNNIFSNINKNNLDDTDIILKNNSQIFNFYKIFSNLEKLQILDTDIFSAILRNAEHANMLRVLICIYKRIIKEREFYQNLFKNINHIELIYRCLEQVKASEKNLLGVLFRSEFGDINYNNHPFNSLILAYCNNGKHTKQIEKIASIFSRLMTSPKYLSSSQDTLCQDISKMISDLSDFNLNEKKFIIYLTFLSACHNDHSHAVELLLNYLDIDVNRNDDEINFGAFNSLHEEIIILLLNDKCLNPGYSYKEIILSHLSGMRYDNSLDLGLVLYTFSKLTKQGLLSEISAKAICLHAANSHRLPKAFSRFHRIGYLNDYLIDAICENLSNFEEIAQLFECLKPVGILSGTTTSVAINRNAIFKQGQYATGLKPLFELMMTAGLFKPSEYYDIILMNTLSPDQKHQNIIIMTQSPIALYQFDENGKKNEIFNGDDLKQALIPLKLDYLLTQNLNKISLNLNSTLEFTELLPVFTLLESQQIQTISLDNRQHNFDTILKLGKYAEPLFDLFKRLDSAGLLLQFVINAISDIGPYIEFVNYVFKFLNRVDKLDKTNCQFILEHAQDAAELNSALNRLELEGNKIDNLFESITVDALCKNPKFSQKMVFLFVILKENNIDLNSEIINLVCQNAPYAASLYSACCILGDQLNEKTFISLCQNPQQAIQSALTRANMSINEAKKINEPGIQDFVKIQEISLTMAGTGGGLLVGESPLIISPSLKNMKKLTFFAFLPKDILHNIASLSGTNTLEQEVQDKLINLNLNSHLILLNAAQSLLTSSEGNKITDIELKEQTMKISFNSPQAATEFYTICNDHSNIYQWTYDSNSSSPKSEIVFKNLNQIQYFISDICQLNFDHICMGYPKFDVVPEEKPNPSPRQ